MALSLLLRASTQCCKVGPALRIPSRYASITSSLYCRYAQVQNDKPAVPSYRPSAIKLNPAVREFSTSEVMKAKPAAAHGDHSKMWSLEKGVSAGLLVILPLGIMYPNILFDLIIAVGVVMHTHWGIEAIVLDYLRPSVVGAVIAKAGHLLTYAISIFMLVGLLNLIFNNAGLGNSIHHIWRI